MSNQRERLTITLDHTILNQVDNLIDGVTVRNRSHAIESILQQHLKPKITKVLILAAGEGEQMRPITYELPKPLIPFHGKPLLEHTLELLKQNGLTDIVISLNYLGDKIKNHFGDGSGFGVRIVYSEEPNLLGTAGGLMYARSLVEDGPFLVIYGDTIFQLDLEKFADFFFEQDAVGAMALTSVENPSTYGVVQIEGNTVVGFTEKPPRSQELSHLISTGIYLFTPKIFDYLPHELPQEPLSLEADIFPSLAKEGTLLGYPFSGQWFDITDPKNYELALKQWAH